MKQADAIAELSDRFPGGSEYDLGDVTAFFAGLKAENVGTVYQCIIRNHEYNTFPKLIKIKKYLAQDGIQVYEKESTREKLFEYYVCKVCRSKYDTEIGWCPVCKKNTAVTVYLSRQKVEGAYEGRQGCAKCDKYSSRNICTTCDKYGQSFSSEICRDCQGLDCCRDRKNLRRKELS